MNTSTRRAISYPQADRSDPPDVPLHFKNLVDFLDLDVVYTQGTDAARVAAAHQTSGGRIWWTTDSLQYWYDDGTTWRLIGASITRGVIASRPAAAAGNANAIYLSTDVNGGTLAYSDGSVWTQMAGSVNPPAGSITSAMIQDATITGADLAGQTTAYVAANYTPVIADRFKLYQVDTGAAARTITLPSDATAAFGIGESIDFYQWGANQIIFAAGSGATVWYNPGLKSNGQYTMVSAIKVGANTWLLVGNLTT